MPVACNASGFFCQLNIYCYCSYFLNLSVKYEFQNAVSYKYRVILSVLDPRKCEYLKDNSLDFEHAYMTTYLAS